MGSNKPGMIEVLKLFYHQIFRKHTYSKNPDITIYEGIIKYNLYLCTGCLLYVDVERWQKVGMGWLNLGRIVL